MRRSVALSTETASGLGDHLLRPDGQEDLCFALWRPSRGRERITALVQGPILPLEGERHVHGTTSFETPYFMRSAQIAQAAGAGIAFLHSHPHGSGWQGMSRPDKDTEHRFAPRAKAVTGLPLVGLTMAGDGSLSARFWERTGRREYRRLGCENVREVGERVRVTWNGRLIPEPEPRDAQVRTVTAWGPEVHADLARMRIGIVGAGSVGSLVAEALARTGVERIVLFDFDGVEIVNLDRLIHATPLDARLARAKVEILRRGLLASATAASPEITGLELSVVEEEGYRAALDCDLVIGCVDRPWGRAALNHIALAHLVPVVDIGIGIRRMPNGRMRSARWRSQVAAPGRRCLECSGQFDSGLVSVERDGSLDDPRYIESLPADHPLRARQNVIAFSMSAAGLALEQALRAVIAPGGYANAGGQRHEFKPGTTTLEREGCRPSCVYLGAIASGEESVDIFQPTGIHKAAEKARADRRHRAHQPRVRLGRWADDHLHGLRWRLGRLAAKHLG
jgi:hypothetical protein